MLTVSAFSFNPFSENTYILHNDQKECILIDPGCSNHQEKHVLEHYIHSNDLQPKYIFLTHTHIDHVMGLNFAKNKWNVPIIAHPLAAKSILATEMVAKLYGLSVETPPEIDEFKNEGDEIILGNEKMSLLFCPGHAPDHLVLYSKENEFAIVGDVIFQGSIGRTDLPGGNFETLMESIHTKLLVLPENTVLFPGHGTQTTIKEEISNNPFLK